MGQFAVGLSRMTLCVIAEERDFEADLDAYLADYHAAMVAAGIEPAWAMATLAELRPIVIEEWNASRASSMRVVDNTLILG